MCHDCGVLVYRNTASRYDLHGIVPDAKRLQSPWVWYEDGDRQGAGATFPDTGLVDTPVQATVVDTYFSSWGGEVMRSLNGGTDGFDNFGGLLDRPAQESLFRNERWAQPVLAQDYDFFVPAPPRPDPQAKLLYRSEERCNTAVPTSPNRPQNDVENNILNGTGDVQKPGEIGAPSCGIPDSVSVSTDPQHPGSPSP